MIRALFLPTLHRPRPGLSALLRRWHSLHRQRTALSQLDPHLLEDIGVTEAEARREAARAPWDAPDHWKL
ncbi:DUF1127 domain-containing protein [Allosediminivita pacifica]|uniref:Uncharacterized protein YjiS (DUF1127 family) n=1 Tax=Allosediminivita pacifica TaxID=1267769 RepID=A0A2T6B0Q4_9RHOB|nr:DUF1127 domain-containing protein [Allosediminivita pacifica]PTX49664.1 uncharacterized protein YjiS (DUF1127 family) [Allosediminivita pacifica]GGB03646.1 hypothetical protein GCM10011324_12300 [Allosediminivita pacifica]